MPSTNHIVPPAAQRAADDLKPALRRMPTDQLLALWGSLSETVERHTEFLADDGYLEPNEYRELDYCTPLMGRCYEEASRRGVAQDDYTDDNH